MSGIVAIGQSQDLDPAAICVVEAVDIQELRHKCEPGVVLFSTAGEAITAGTTWDFDGDFFVLIENQKLIPRTMPSDMSSDVSPQMT